MMNKTNLRDRMLAVMADVNAQVAEREDLIELIAIALLTRKNLFILGAPGQAKSYAINAFRSRITGARQFERLLSKQTDEEQLFGRVDLASLLPGSIAQSVLDQDAQYRRMHDTLKDRLTNNLDAGDLPERMERHRKALAELHGGEPHVNTAGKIPEADIVFLDEIFKCNDGVLNSLLTALNERKYTNEGRTYLIPTISFFAASNEIPNFADPQEKILEALYDRLELKVVTENIADRGKRLAVLKDKQADR
ncbi:MAG: AAA family ATPase, partial [Muribaculaceae bacterium]|nr:AAA family ATPase [Muribaculaceae bacterium]